MKRKMRKASHVLIFIAVLAVAIAVVMLLWNALIPSIIGWSAINYWQAAGLVVLSKLLFGGFGHHFRGHHRFGGGCHGHGRNHSREEMRHIHDAMKGMSRDERREFIRERMSHGFGDDAQTIHNEEY